MRGDALSGSAPVELVAGADDEVVALAWSATGALAVAARAGAPLVVPPAGLCLPAPGRLGSSVLAWHPDGTTLAVGALDGTVVLAAPEGATTLDTGGPVRALAWAGDRLGVVAGHHVAVHRRDGALTRSWPFQRWSGHACAWSRWGWLVVGGPRGLRAFDPEAAGPGPVWSSPAPGAALAVVRHPDPDRDTVAVADLAGEVRLVDVGGTDETVLSGYPDRVRLAVWCAGGAAVAAEADDEVTVWGVGPGGSVSERPVHLVRHPGSVRSLAASPVGPLAASGDDAGTLLVWGAADGEVVHHLRTGEPVSALAWSPDGRRLAAGLRSGTVVAVEVAPP